MSRRGWRRAGLWAAVAVVVVLTVVTAVRWRAARELSRAAERFEEAIGPLDFPSWRPPEVPDGENAALPILEVLRRTDVDGEIGSPGRPGPARIDREGLARLRATVRLSLATWTDEDLRLARETVGSPWATVILAKLHQAADRPRADFRLDYDAGAEMEIPNLLRALEARDLLLAEARLAWLDGRSAAGARAVAAISTLSRALQVEAPLIFQLVGEQVEVGAYRAIQDALATPGSGAADAEVLRVFRDAVERPSRPDLLDRALGGEGTFLYSTRPGGRFGKAIAAPLPWYDRLRYRWFGDASVAAGLDYFVRASEAFPETIARGGAPADWPAPPRASPTSQVVPNLHASLDTFWAAEMLRHLTRLALDIEEMKTQSGSFPAALPVDTLTELFPGARPRYERAPDGSATLELPGAEEVAARARPGRQREPGEEVLFTWILAAPGATSAPPG